MTTINTRFGEIDAEGLEALRLSFDVGEILDAAEKLKTIGREMDKVRGQLEHLHRMARELIKDGDIPGASQDGGRMDAIWEQAEALSLSMQDWPQDIEAVRQTLSCLEQLAPWSGDYYESVAENH